MKQSNPPLTDLTPSLQTPRLNFYCVTCN